MTRNICIAILCATALSFASCAEDAPTTSNIAPPPPTVDTLAVRHDDSLAVWNAPSGLVKQQRTPNWFFDSRLHLYDKHYNLWIIANNVAGLDATDMRLDGPPHTRIWIRWYDARIPAECRFYGRYDSTGIRGHILVRHMMGDVLMPLFWWRS